MKLGCTPCSKVGTLGVETKMGMKLSKEWANNLLLLLLSAFPISQGWPQRIIILHIFLSSMSVSFTPTSFISSFTTYKNLLFGPPLLLFPGNFLFFYFYLHFHYLSSYILLVSPHDMSIPPQPALPHLHS